MQKSKIATIGIIILILLYGIFATFNLSIKANIAYLYIINPMFWVILAIILSRILGKTAENKKLKTKVTQFSMIAALVYIIIYLLSGLFVTFGKNPYSTGIKGLLINLWISGSVIIAKEYIRVQLINNVYEKHKIKIAILISIVYILIDLQINSFIGKQLNLLVVFKYFSQTFIPLLTKNILYSYTALYCGWKPAAIYEFMTSLFLWIAPIWPKTPWVMNSIIDAVIPLILFLYIRFEQSKTKRIRNREEIESTDPKSIIILVVVIILIIWFAVGIFPIKPVAIASASMEKELYVGDVALIKKCNSNDVEVGDIIEYQMDGYTVIHRVIKKTQKKGEFYYTTKGDNNKTPDKDEVREEQLIGKVIYKVKYIGFPAVWLHIVQSNNLETEVERGQ